MTRLRAVMQVGSSRPVELSNVALLTSALVDALEAQAAGVLGRPGLDELASAGTQRRAAWMDAMRVAGPGVVHVDGAA